MKKNRKISTCNWLDLEPLGSRPLMLKIIFEHCLLQCKGRARSLILGPINVMEVKVSLVKKTCVCILMVTRYVFITPTIGGGENIDFYL